MGEFWSRILPLAGYGNFPNQLRSELLASAPRIFEENLLASYILRTAPPGQYIHNSTRAGICVTAGGRLVIVASRHKRMDIPLTDPHWLRGITITHDKIDRIVFKVDLGTYGTGKPGSSWEFRIRTKSAGRVKEIVEQASKDPDMGKESDPPAYVSYGAVTGPYPRAFEED